MPTGVWPLKITSADVHDTNKIIHQRIWFVTKIKQDYISPGAPAPN